MSGLFNLFAFSSESSTNIWAAVGAELWALPSQPNNSARGKAGRISIPSFGVFYSVADKSLTVPFVVLEQPDQNRIERAVWHGEWALPFRIKSLHTPRKMLTSSDAKKMIPSFERLKTSDFGKVFRFGGAYAFNRCDVDKNDWDILLDKLAI